MACVKHFADNSQEKDRMSINENIDERTQFELYFPPFEASVKAGVGSAMCSYNKINGVYACQNKEELMDDLRGYMGFKGFVMSDWGAAHALALDEGLDQEQFSVSIPWYYTHRALKKAPIASVDTSVKRIFKSFMDLGIFDTLHTRPNDTAFSVNASTPERKAFTQDLVHQSSVLLKNDNEVLPLKKPEGQHYLVIGNQATNPVTFGGGSGESHPLDVLPPLHALCDELGLERMSTWSVYNKHCNETNGNCITYVDIPSNAGGPHYSVLFLGKKYITLDELVKNSMFEGLFDFKYDKTMVFLGLKSSEMWDRNTLGFSWTVDLIWDLTNFLGKNRTGEILTFLNAPGPSVLDFADKVDAIIYSGMPGEGYARALVNMLYGRENPSGKLTVTFPNKDNE
jgi:beta-glucosidase